MASISTSFGLNYDKYGINAVPYNSDSKSFKVTSFGKKEKRIVTPEEYKHDELVGNGAFSKFKVNAEKTANIPLVHFPRGLGGAPDFTFFEFLQTAKFPYYVGGPILAALFYAGIKFDSFQSAKPAKNVAKHMALGVGLYYAGTMLAKSLINTTVKLSRGIDLEQPYRKIIPTSTNQTGAFQKDIEYHKLLESIDFTRWDLLYGEGKDNQEINKKYNKLAKKYGMKDPNPNDADSTLKPLIRKTIAMGRAWQYALSACFVTLGIGMANQKAWETESASHFKLEFKDGIVRNFIKPLKSMKNKDKKVLKEEISHYWGLGAKNTKNFVMGYMIKPFGKSFMQFWHGQNKLTSIAGKTTIITSAAALLLANFLILTKTSARNHKTERTTGNKPQEVNKK